jgi:hypothetical protein
MSVRSLLAGLMGTGIVLLFAVACQAAAPPCAQTLERLTETGCPGQFASERPSGMKRQADGLVACVYPVADLVVPLGSTGPEKAPKTQEDRLIGIITSTISPQSWTTVGGPGCIDYFPLGMALVIRHTPAVQEQIADLLAALRRLQDVEVAVEVRFLTVSDECLQKLGIGTPAAQEQGGDGEGGKRDLARLDDAQVRLLLEGAQGDQRANVMQAPKLTVFNGQKAVLNLTETQCFVTGVEMVPSGEKMVPRPKAKNVDTGLMLAVQPVVAPDNKTVTMELEVNLSRMDAIKAAGITLDLKKTAGALAGTPIVLTEPAPHASARSFRTVLKMTDGTTALLRGWTLHREVRNQTCPPVLSKVPYIGQLFRTFSYGKEREHLLVMVTARVLVRHEEEEKAPPVQRTGAILPQPQESQAQPVPVPDPAPTTPEAPVPEAMHVNRRSIRMDYALENVGPAGVSKIEVWYTRDAQKWNRHEETVPAKGHATITVREDGRWGFTLIAHSGTGMSATPPSKGAQPQVWVEVDTVAPEVSFQEAVRLVDGVGQLQVVYHCDDAHLKERPVTISCAPTPDGPWTVLARHLDASGTFTCLLESLPHECHVRVEAEDQAGNVGRKVSGLIHADVKVPQVRKVKVTAEE